MGKGDTGGGWVGLMGPVLRPLSRRRP
ncbi:uncharacterized protein G2W53_031666 [Senna tora]|uniref:Uncharacterized protein n=1 Tax=Senna tora TaxID=362788 RepID=A0A834TB79_9FABA|nr:uncharacterized protein G2W53_031666 [Senna tora]